MLNVNKWYTAHEENKVPGFFRKKWQQKHGEDPLSNHERAVAHGRKEDRASLIAFMASSCFVFFGFCRLFMTGPAPADDAERKVIFIIAIASVPIALVAWITYWMIRRKRENWHYEEYYQSLETLFGYFQIYPSLELGKMSEEIFAKATVGSLRAEAQRIDRKEGFERTGLMDKWKRMHAAALAWELCKEGYEHYFPKPETAVK